MGWKDWPTWLKVGIIGFCIGVILLILLIFMLTIEDRYLNYTIISIIFIPVTLAAYAFCEGNNTPCVWITVLLVGLVYPVIFFLIGSLIGWIVGKFKSKNVQ